MKDIAKIARDLLASLGHRDPRLPSDEDLGALARAYLESQKPQSYLYVSGAAAHEHARRLGRPSELEAARLDLTRLLRYARQVVGDPSQWRARIEGKDISVKVKREGDILVATVVNIRRYC